MPEINHKAPEVTAKTVAAAIADSGVKAADLEKQIEAILQKRKLEAAEAAKPKEPDWSKISEKDAYNPATYIPVIEHDIPDYMNIKLKDAEYEVVWASRDQRRLGQLLAEGYEFLKPEHISPNFSMPLTFNSEKQYIYQDVIAMRVHKRILYGKRRRALEISQAQLRAKNKLPQQRIKGTFDLAPEVPDLEPGLSLYETKA